MDGKAVYEDHYADNLHSSEHEFTPIKGADIILAFDFGLTPACAIGQITPVGQLRILEELTTERMGLEGFVDDVVSPRLKTAYRGHRFICVGDPSGVSGSDTDERSCFDILESRGFDPEPAPSNSPEARLGAVRWWLGRLVGKGVPAFQLSSVCKTLRKGFLGGYQYKRLQVSGTAKFREVPDKNFYSHIHDSLQYLCLVARPEHLEDFKDSPQFHSGVVHAADTVSGY